MDAPKCRVCGEKHWASGPHQFKGSRPVESDVVKSAVVGSVNELETLRARVAELEAQLAGKRAYMREYMRKRRSR